MHFCVKMISTLCRTGYILFTMSLQIISIFTVQQRKYPTVKYLFSHIPHKVKILKKIRMDFMDTNALQIRDNSVRHTRKYDGREIAMIHKQQQSQVISSQYLRVQHNIWNIYITWAPHKYNSASDSQHYQRTYYYQFRAQFDFCIQDTKQCVISVILLP